MPCGQKCCQPRICGSRELQNNHEANLSQFSGATQEPFNKQEQKDTVTQQNTWQPFWTSPSPSPSPKGCRAVALAKRRARGAVSAKLESQTFTNEVKFEGTSQRFGTRVLDSGRVFQSQVAKHVKNLGFMGLWMESLIYDSATCQLMPAFSRVHSEIPPN